MKKFIYGLSLALVITSFALTAPLAWAKHDGDGPSGGGNPPGWEHGKKVGWHGEHRPPGLAKKEGEAGKKHHKRHKHHPHHEGEKEEEKKEGT